MQEHDFKIFMKSVNRTDSCWLWTRCLSRNGYGVFRINRKQEYVHRLMYEHTLGKPLSGQVIRHSCNRSNCVNPKHLIAGSQRQNMLDRVRNNLVDIQETQKMLAAGKSLRDIGRYFGVHHSTVQHKLRLIEEL